MRLVAQADELDRPYSREAWRCARVGSSSQSGYQGHPTVGPTARETSRSEENEEDEMTLRTIGIVLSVGALAGCAAEKSVAPPRESMAPPAATAAAPPGGVVGEETVTGTATVQKVDMKTRHVTLKRSDGKEFTIVAGPEVRNLAQVKKGDVVRLTYRESIAYQVQAPGAAKPGVGASTDVTRAAPGEKPGGSVTDTVTVRVTITAIDKAHSEVSLRGPEGNVNVVKVRDPSKLDTVKVGDIVDITYTEALAVSVEKAGKK
jgi:hypothetical protein